MIKVDDWTPPLSSYLSRRLKKNNLKRNVLIGTSLGLSAAALILSKGKIKNLLNMNYGIKEVMTLCTGSAIGGWLSANLTTKDNFKGRTIELKNQLLYNDFIPLLILKGVDVVCTLKNKFLRSLVLLGSSVAATYFGHALCKKELKKKNLKENYPVEAYHLLTDLDDFLFPVALATKSRGLQQFLKIISPITYLPLGIHIGLEKDSKYLTNH